MEPTHARARRIASLLVVAAVGVPGCAALKRCAYEGFGRDDWQRPGQVIAALGLEPGDRVADLGAGGGYFTFRLAEAVGPSGRVYAVDVDPDMVDHLRDRAEAEGVRNLEVVLASPDDPKLPDGQIDLVFTSNTYHHIGDRVDYFRRLRTDLSPRGRVAILELDDSTWFPRTMGHFTGKEEIAREMGQAGYRLERELDLVERQSFSIFSAGP